MELAKEKRGLFCTVNFIWRNFFNNCVFISVYSILNTLSEYTYFYISKNITSYPFVACFKNRRKPSVYILHKKMCLSRYGELPPHVTLYHVFLKPPLLVSFTKKWQTIVWYTCSNKPCWQNDGIRIFWNR